MLEPGHDGADDHGTRAEARDERRRARAQVALAPQDHHHAVTVDADERVVRRAARRPPKLGRPDVVERLGHGADHDERLTVAAPAECGDARPQGVVRVAADDGVHDEGLEAGVPRAAGLGRAGVHLGRGEGHLAGVAQDGLPEVALAARSREPVAVVLHHLDEDPDQLQGLLERDRPRELGRGGREDLVRPRRRAARVREPRDEAGDARLDDQADPGPVLSRQCPVPGQSLVQLARGCRGEQSAPVVQPTQGVGLITRGRWHVDEDRGTGGLGHSAPL
ncbi:hypothetical protein N867_13320 [Actinotalea fermentans ATCC 43279 = JCM 9966 = DSM 3133]|nr:hypothetical protein N867_13320 [Actinotalea fermentans ATCC 43279 = JCM 9966 = DSM 3133]